MASYYLTNYIFQQEALAHIAHVLFKKDSAMLGLKNKSEKHWDAMTSKGALRKVALDEVIPLKYGISFTVDDATVKIEKI